MAVAQKRLPLRCILCRAKILRIKQDHRGKDGTVVQSKDELVHSDTLSGLPKSVSGYNITNYISSSGSNYSFTSGKSSHFQNFFLWHKIVFSIVILSSLLAIITVINFHLIQPAPFAAGGLKTISSSSPCLAWLRFVIQLFRLSIQWA